MGRRLLLRRRLRPSAPRGAQNRRQRTRRWPRGTVDAGSRRGAYRSRQWSGASRRQPSDRSVLRRAGTGAATCAATTAPMTSTSCAGRSRSTVVSRISPGSGRTHRRNRRGIREWLERGDPVGRPDSGGPVVANPRNTDRFGGAALGLFGSRAARETRFREGLRALPV